VRVLDEELVDVLAGRVGGIGGGVGLVAVLVRVDVGGRAGKKHAVAGVDEVGGLARGEVERDGHGLTAGAGDGLGILRPRLAVVVEVGTGGDGDSDARRHGSTS